MRSPGSPSHSNPPLSSMGFGKSMQLNEVLDFFGAIVTNVSNSFGLQEECYWL